MFYVDSGGDSGQPDGAPQAEEQGATGGKQTASAASGDSGKVCTSSTADSLLAVTLCTEDTAFFI